MDCSFEVEKRFE